MTLKRTIIYTMIIIFLLTGIGVLLALILYMQPGGNSRNTGGNTVYYSENYYFYHPEKKAVKYDKKSETLYYNNIVIAYLDENLSEAQRENIAKEINGELVGSCSGALNLIQIKIKPAKYEKLADTIQKLAVVDGVMYATHDAPSMMEISNSVDNDQNDWGGETDKGNRENPSGKDWWAEAIDAYTAWDVAEGRPRITVGVLDFGFEVNHEDFEGNLTMLNSPQGEKTAFTDHGTHVAGLMAAQDNTVGIRGVSSGSDIIAMNVKPNGVEQSYAEMGAMLALVVERGAKVVNQSSADTYYTKQQFIDKDLKKQYGTYENYQSWYINTGWKESASSVIWTMYNMYRSGYNDYLVVVAAGNGEGGGGGKGIDSVYSGMYCGVNELSFEYTTKELGVWATLAKMTSSQKIISSVESRQEELQRLGIHYFTDRIMVVGAVTNQRTSDGDYHMAEYSNFDVDLCAPGGDNNQGIYSLKTYQSGSYGDLPGTSMASPIAAGTAALVWAIDPDMQPADIKKLLISETDCKALDDDYASASFGASAFYPMLNAGKAAKKAYFNHYGIEWDKDTDAEAEFWESTPNWSSREISDYFSHHSDLVNDWGLTDKGSQYNLGLENLWSDGGFSYGRFQNNPDDFIFADKVISDVTLFGIHLEQNHSDLEQQLWQNGWFRVIQNGSYRTGVVTPMGKTIDVVQYLYQGTVNGREARLNVVTDPNGVVLYWWMTNYMMATQDDAIDYFILGYDYPD